MPSTGYKTQGYCLDASMADATETLLTSSASESDCLAKCRATTGAKGCEYNTNGWCAYHTEQVSQGSNDADWSCWNFEIAGN